MKAKGRHPEKALSAVGVRAIKEPGRYTDGNGLYLVVDRSGAKRWMLRTVVHGKRCDIGLGGLRLVSLAEARETASTYRKLARDGGDPLAERRQERLIIPTFEQAARSVHAELGCVEEPETRGAMDQHARRVCLSDIRRPPRRSHRYARRAQGAVADLADQARNRAAHPAADRHGP